MSTTTGENGAGERSGEAKTEQKCQFVKENEIARGKWLALKEYTYSDPQGKERQWEVLERTTRQQAAADAVIVMAVLRRILHYDCVIFVKQYRPPLKAYTVEFPAGLVDGGESSETTALRELLEETGYTAVIKHCSPATCLDPGTENCTVTVVTAEIDGDEEINKNPKPKLEDGEFIEVLLIPVNTLLDKLNEYSQAGLVVDARCYTYAIALTQATKERHLQPAQK